MKKATILCIAIIFLFLASCVKPNVPPEEEDLLPPTVDEPEPPNNVQEDQDEDYNLDDVFSDEEEVQPPIIPA